MALASSVLMFAASPQTFLGFTSARNLCCCSSMYYQPTEDTSEEN